MLTDSSTQHPHGLGQAFVAEMLGPKGWQLGGFMKWVSSLCDDYQRRRNLFLDVFRREIGDSGLASAETPSAGMFIWIKIHFERHHRRQAGLGSVAQVEHTTSVEHLADELFRKLFDSGLIVMPAKTFAIMGENSGTAEGTPIHEVSVVFGTIFHRIGSEWNTATELLPCHLR